MKLTKYILADHSLDGQREARQGNREGQTAAGARPHRRVRRDGEGQRVLEVRGDERAWRTRRVLSSFHVLSHCVSQLRGAAGWRRVDE